MKVLGFSDVSVTPRMKKHEGKIMRKVGRKLIESFEGLVAGRSLSDEEREEQFSNYMKDMLQYFDIASLSDLVALRVVINKLHGVRVDDMGEDAKNMALRLAMSAIKSNLHRLNTLQDVAYKDCKPEFKKTETGYRAYHYDTVPDGALVGRLLRFEVQLKTSDWHNIAEEGGAAHYYYLGGDQRFVSTLSHSYKNLIHLLRNGSNV
jgi:hypothetical protein